jgi:hypothetical protein
MYIAIKYIYPAVILSTSVVFAGLISISIVNSSEQENAGPANETSSDSNYYSNII